MICQQHDRMFAVEMRIALPLLHSLDNHRAGRVVFVIDMQCLLENAALAKKRTIQNAYQLARVSTRHATDGLQHQSGRERPSKPQYHDQESFFHAVSGKQDAQSVVLATKSTVRRADECQGLYLGIETANARVVEVQLTSVRHFSVHA
ncbi:hypothetical protein MRB53_038713 [Persea americana]|nr:hypothetical protein MRB53_038713 [Persea americana]